MFSSTGLYQNTNAGAAPSFRDSGLFLTWHSLQIYSLSVCAPQIAPQFPVIVMILFVHLVFGKRNSYSYNAKHVCKNLAVFERMFLSE